MRMFGDCIRDASTSKEGWFSTHTSATLPLCLLGVSETSAVYPLVQRVCLPPATFLSYKMAMGTCIYCSLCSAALSPLLRPSLIFHNAILMEQSSPPLSPPLSPLFPSIPSPF